MKTSIATKVVRIQIFLRPSQPSFLAVKEGHYGKFVVKAVQVTSQSQSLRHSRCYCPLRAGCL